jgi:hypothetical protein
MASENERREQFKREAFLGRGGWDANRADGLLLPVDGVTHEESARLKRQERQRR